MTQRITPAEPIAPGEYINDEMEARGWTQDDLAEILGRSRAHVNRLIAGHTAIGPETAHELAQAFGTDAALWMNLQISYELALVQKKNRDIERRAKLYAMAPVKEMIRRGWIVKHNDIDKMEEEICRFFRIRSIDEKPASRAAAKKSTPYGAVTPEQLAWEFRARQLAECTRASRYDESKLPSILNNLRILASNAEDLRRVPAFLAEAGIRLVLVEGLKSKIDALAFWLDDDSPVIAHALRFDRIDNFWHTLMHEMIHIKYREEAPIDVDLDSIPSDDLPEMEQRANKEAAELLVPQDKLDSFVIRTRPLYYQTKVVQFAQARAIHPGVVVGQLQRRGELEYTHLRKLLVKCRERIVGQAVTDGWGNSPVIRN